MEQDYSFTKSSTKTEGHDLTVDDLLSKCHGLIEEIQQFRVYLAQYKKEKEVDIQRFYNTILSEQKSIEKVSYTCNPSSH